MHNFLKATRRSGLLLIALLSVLLQWGCSTQKNTFVNRTYHTVNAKYNGFFNARENYRQGIVRLSESHVDNYDQVLSVFRYGTEQDRPGVRGQMEIAYEKASLVIRRHSMNIRGVEHNKWIDESYFLIGKTQFFRQEYTLAILTFEYIIRQYDTQRSYDAKAWIAKSYHEQGRYDQARAMLELLEKNYRDGHLAKETTVLFRKTYADHFARQGNHAEAASQLDQAMSYVEERSEKSRLTFITAQLYQHAGQFALAQQTYARVLEMRPDFNLAFQARIGMAMAYDPSVGGSAAIRSQLMDMFESDRNSPFFDQIYYALAQLALRRGDEAEAINMLERSAAASRDNQVQKGLSHLRLGEIYFNRPDYLNASMHYDSAATFLPSGYEDMEEVMALQSVLSDIARQARIIEREDSLQHLASLPSNRQLAVIDGIIAELREEETLARQEERERDQAMREAAQMARQTRGMGDQDRGWYFYNPNAISQGKNEFFGRFGDRPLEDMWRIGNRRTMASGFDDMDWDETEMEKEEEPGDVFSRDSYLRNIPNTPEQLKASNERMARAYYQMGMIFRDRLRDPNNAIDSFESLVMRFPGSDPELRAYYYLYYLHRDAGNTTAAQNVRNSLLSRYPESEYAKIIGDPAYLDRLRERQGLAERLYEESYHAFFAGRHDVVVRNMRALDTLDVSHDLKAQFQYLYALALGNQEDQSLLRDQLEHIISTYEDTGVHGPASILLASLERVPIPSESEKETGDGRPADDQTQDFAPYSFVPGTAHFFVAVVNSRENDPRRISQGISAFNEDRYPDVELAVSSVFFQEGMQLITVTNFPGKDAAMAYYRDILQSEMMGPVQDQFRTLYVISVDNYPVFYQEKDLDLYERFFDYHYRGN